MSIVRKLLSAIDLYKQARLDFDGLKSMQMIAGDVFSPPYVHSSNVYDLYIDLSSMAASEIRQYLVTFTPTNTTDVQIGNALNMYYKPNSNNPTIFTPEFVEEIQTNDWTDQWLITVPRGTPALTWMTLKFYFQAVGTGTFTVNML